MCKYINDNHCLMLTYHILKQAGLDVERGNVETVWRYRLPSSRAYYVLELSRFPAGQHVQFKADVAILMNITPDPSGPL